MSTTPTTLTKYEQYGMFIGFLKAVETVLPSPVEDASDELIGTILSSLNTRIVETLFPEHDFDEEKLYHIQEEMHKLRISDRVISLMEEIHERMPKKRNGSPDMSDRERVMDALFPRKEEEDSLK